MTSTPTFALCPDKDPGRYGLTANNNRSKCAQLVSDFFKYSAKRARERNARHGNLEAAFQDSNILEARKEHLWSATVRKEAQYLRFLRTKYLPENYETIKNIGKGTSGEVNLVHRKSNGQVYALKSLVKSELPQREQLAHIRADRDIWADAESLWVVKLYTTFQDTHLLYKLMEFLQGGDLLTLLIESEILSEDTTRFYMAECVAAVEAVHALGFIHRNIKPRNILLDREGHIKLTDFGLSTGFHRLRDSSYYQQLLQDESNTPRDQSLVGAIDEINLAVHNRPQINEWRQSRRYSRSYSVVGTPDYIAPEILSGPGYSYGCDWWSVGTIMYECLVGWPPFCAEDCRATIQKILDWQQTLSFPHDISLGREAEGLIRDLLCNAEGRLGDRGAEQVKSHPFFHGVQFEDLRRIRAPFEPRLASSIDTKNFPVDEIDQIDTATSLHAEVIQPQQPGESLEMSLPFVGYTFQRFNNNFQ